MSLNNVRAVGDDRPWKDEVERELKGIWDSLKYGKISLRASTGGTTGGGGGGGGGGDLGAINATLPATYDTVTYTIGVDQDSFDRIANLDYAQFDVTTAAARDVGRLMWNDTDGTLEFGLKGGLVTLQIGQEQVVRVRNATAGTLTEGTVCYFNGSNGTNFNVTPAIASSDPTSAQTMGVLTETLNTSSTQHGFLTTFGMVRNIDLSYISGLADGDQLYLDPTTAGRMTKVKPVAPEHLVYIGICLSAAGGGSNSTIFVKVQNGYELGELHDVDTTGATTGQVLQLQSDGVWKPSSAGTGSVTSVATGTGLTGGPITTTGTISLSDTAVTTGSYGSGSAVGTFTVDQQGRLTAAGSTSIAIAGSQITSGTVAVANGGTGASTDETARANLSAVGVFTQDTEPVGGNIGDIWIDTDSGQNVIGATVRFEASKVGTSQNISDSSATILTTPTIVENVGGFTYSAGSITVPLTGRYALVCGIYWAQSSAGRRVLRFRRNGTDIWSVRQPSDSQAGSMAQLISVPSDRFNSGDIIQVEVVQGSGSTLSIAETRLVIEYLGA